MQTFLGLLIASASLIAQVPTAKPDPFAPPGKDFADYIKAQVRRKN